MRVTPVGRGSPRCEPDRGRRARQGVLFVHSATMPPLGADTWVHAQIMRGLDRSAYDVHAACVPGPHHAPTPTFRLLRTLPDVGILPIDLGPERFSARHRGRMG